MSCGVGRRHSLDGEWLWLWCRPAATAPIGPPSWEPPHATGVALKSKKIKIKIGDPVVAQWLTNPTRNHEVAGLIPGLAQWVKDPALP